MIVLCIPTLSPAGAQRTVRLIDRAFRGTLRPDRVFVVDNGGHMADLPTISRVEVLSPGFNMGVGPAWNEALRRFPKAWIVFANDDVTLAPDSLGLLDRACRNEGALMVGTAGHSFSLFLTHPALIRKVGYFDEGFAPAYYEDTDYLRRMQLAGVERAIVETGATHHEQSTSRDMGWDPWALINKQGVRYQVKWGGLAGEERFAHPWNIDFEVCVPSVRTNWLQRLIDSLAWQTVRPPVITIASNADIQIDTRGLRVRQLRFSSKEYAIGEGDASLRRNVATWAAQAPYIVYSDDDQVWPQDAMEWFVRRFATGDHLVVGHHRFIDDLDTNFTWLRNAPAENGASRESPPNASHLWQSCWGGSLGMNAMLLKFGVGGWDMGYPASEDQQLARRVLGMGDAGRIRVHEPPFAWHEKTPPRLPRVQDPNTNVCRPGMHQHFEDGETLRCANCPIVRRANPQAWPTIQLYDPTKVVTEERWL